MAFEPERVILTYEDLQATPADRNRYEIIDGELYVTAAPNTAHQVAVTKLTVQLGAHVFNLDLGMVLTAPYDVYFTDIDVVEPDLIFVSKQNRAIVEAQYIRGVPDLVIEVRSPSTSRADRHVKRQLFERFGVPYYWMVDPDARALTVLALDGDHYRVALQAHGDEMVNGPPPFPQLVLRLGELWHW